MSKFQCLRCDSPNFNIENVDIKPLIEEGVDVAVVCEAYICKDCGNFFMDTPMMDELIEKTRCLREIEKNPLISKSQ